MPRPARHIEPATTYHLISRFVDREWFIKFESEREYYLRLLGRALEESDWRLLAYAIMSNHLHLAAVAGVQPLSDWIRRVHAPFATSMNRSHDRIGPMFVRGPKAIAVAPESFPDLLAYIHNNPVRAEVCSAAGNTTWTSHRAYTRAASTPVWLHVDEGLARAGFDDRVVFDTWVNDPARAETDVLFTEAHYARLEANLPAVPLPVVHDRTADAIVVSAANIVGIPVEKVQSRTRGESERLAREVAVRAACALGVSGRAVAKSLCLSQQRVSVLRRETAARGVRLLSEEVARRIETDKWK